MPDPGLDYASVMTPFLRQPQEPQPLPTFDADRLRQWLATSPLQQDQSSGALPSYDAQGLRWWLDASSQQSQQPGAQSPTQGAPSPQLAGAPSMSSQAPSSPDVAFDPATGHPRITVRPQASNASDQNAPYFAEGEDQINQAFIDRDLAKLHRRGIGPGDLTPEESADRFNRLRGAASVMGMAGGVAPAAGITGADFYERHADDPNWMSAIPEEAAPLVASTVAGPLVGKALGAAVRYAPKATAAAAGGAGILGLMSDAGEVEAAPHQQQPWEAAGVSRAVWDSMSTRAQNNLLIEAGKRAQEEAAVNRSMPDPDRLKQLGVSPNEWRVLKPEERSTLIAQSDERERLAATPWRELHPGLSTSMPYIAGAAMSALPYIGRGIKAFSGNRVARNALENIEAGRTAFGEGDNMAGRFAYQNAIEGLKKYGAPPSASVFRKFLGHVGSYGVPAAVGALASQVPEDVDIGQKSGTPYKQAAIDRLFSKDALVRAALGAGAVEIPSLLTKQVPTLPHPREYPSAENKAFIKTFRPKVRDLEAAEKERSKGARARAKAKNQQQ